MQKSEQNMEQEYAKLVFPVYRMPSGDPTCSRDVKTGENCQWLGSKNFGLEMVCRFLDEPVHRITELGYLVPHEKCLMWPKKSNAKTKVVIS
jgi:hypothetical protein